MTITWLLGHGHTLAILARIDSRFYIIFYFIFISNLFLILLIAFLFYFRFDFLFKIFKLQHCIVEDWTSLFIFYTVIFVS